jgi:8-oxo-dGTP pyrophosphatase MutT (NUDIX family)
VPWRERLHWFQDLAGRASGLPIRQAVRAVVVDPDGRVLMLRYGADHDTWWITPGGGIDPGESDEQALRRELREELGIGEFELGPLLFERERHFLGEPGYGGQTNRSYLVRVPHLEARVVSEADEARWFALDELDALPTSPYDLPRLLTTAIGS